MITGVQISAGFDQGTDRLPADAPSAHQVQGRSSLSIPYIRVGAVLQQETDPPAMAVIGVMVEQGAAAHLFVDVPSVPK